jgi:uncharacterized protein (DUF302 family)
MDIVKAATTAALVLSAETATASDLITKPSAHSVSVTIDRLVSAVETAGAKVFARVDHASGATLIGSDLRPTEMLMFGNPKLGTPALQLSQSAGLDLPLRVVAYQDATGQVFLAYHAPAKLSDTHAIPADAEVLKKMTGALDKLTNKAVGE